MKSDIDRLLRERQATILRERRSIERQPFVRPVFIVSHRNGDVQIGGFSKDMSPHGIAVISPNNWQSGTLATLSIHSLFGAQVNIRAEARWSEPYGEGWHITGWHFVDLT